MAEGIGVQVGPSRGHSLYEGWTLTHPPAREGRRLVCHEDARRRGKKGL